MVVTRILNENEVLKIIKQCRTTPKQLLITGILLLQLFQCFSQTRYLDSLRKKVYQANNNHSQLVAVFNLLEEANSLHPDTLYRYYNLASSLAVHEKDSEKIIRPRLYAAMFLSRKGMFDSAEAIVDSCIKAMENTGYTDLSNSFMFLKSNLLIRENRQKEAINNSLQLLQSADVAKDVKAQTRAKITIGWAFMELGQNRDALNWFFAAEQLQKTLPQDQWQPFLYSDIAAVYNELKKNDSASFYIKKSLEEALQKNDLSYLANTYFIYGGICADMGQKDKAVSLLEKGLQVRKLIGDPFFIVSDIYQMGLFYADNQQTEKGIAILHDGIAMAYQNKLFEKLPILYSALAHNYKIAGNYKEYAFTLDTLIQLKDSLYKKNSADALAEMQTKYEVQKKENTIIHQHYDLVKKDLFIYIFGGISFITLLIGFFLFQNRKKNQRLKLQAIEMKQKRELTQAVMNAEEEERKRIAEDLHDSVAQKMVVAKLNLEALGINMDFDNKKKTIFENISTLLKDSTDEVRNLSHSMMPHAFEKYGLTNSIKDSLNKIHKKDLKINFNADGDFSMIIGNKAIFIYRIIQECIQNALKHADATNLDISLLCTNNEADIIVEDNGKGFEVNENNKGNGLKNIQSRVEFLNGKLEINSVPGKGTVIAIFLPL
ncbi:MAG: sensor histidine kinase [Bacteroidetes bacterium]|nr:sensor histidine kinase [Bacteroidota bacterium]